MDTQICFKRGDIVRKCSDTTFIAVVMKALDENKVVIARAGVEYKKVLTFKTSIGDLTVHPRNLSVVNSNEYTLADIKFINPAEAVSKIYNGYKQAKASRLEREKHKKERKKIAKMLNKLNKRTSRLYSSEIPNHIQWNISHPFQGGGCSGK